jgi:putative transposase
MRKTQLVENEYYHIYNRGVDKRNVFSDDFDYIRFLQSIQEFNNVDPIGSLYEKNIREKKNGSLASFVEAKLPKLVEIICYCQNPNHYHFILKQISEKGIEKFMHKLGTGYTKYFNQKYKRTGSLFQGPFKSAQINPNNFLYLSAYVNCNSEVHGIAKAENYRWCSFQDYIGKRSGKLCSKKIILDQFKNQKDYFDFAKKNAVAMKEKKEFQKLLIE